jgi:hypothetical protein
VALPVTLSHSPIRALRQRSAMAQRSSRGPVTGTPRTPAPLPGGRPLPAVVRPDAAEPGPAPAVALAADRASAATMSAALSTAPGSGRVVEPLVVSDLLLAVWPCPWLVLRLVVTGATQVFQRRGS